MERGRWDSGAGPLGEAVLTALFTRAQTPMYLLDTQLRVTYANTAAQDTHRPSGGAPAGRYLWDLLPDTETDRLREALGQVLETGTPRLGVLLQGRTAGPGHRPHVLSLDLHRLQDADGRILGIAAAATDGTEEHRARSRQALLHQAAGSIGTTLDVLRTAQELADLTVPALADGVAVDVLDSVLRGQAPPSGPLLDSLPLRRAAYSARPGGENIAIHQVGEVSAFASNTPYTACLADLRPRLVTDIQHDPAWLAREPERRRRFLASGVHSLLLVPLTARGVVLGLAVFLRWHTPDPFDRQDLDLAADLSARTALCLDNARLYQRERSIARLLQLDLRPPQVAAHIAVDTAHTYRPTGPGADWFDVIPLSSARVALAVGDIPAPGLQSAARVGELRVALTALSAMDLPPDEVLERLHALTVRFRAELPPQEPHRPVSCLYAVYDPVTGRCTAASSGHPPPAILWPDGTVSFAEIPAGPILGRGNGQYKAAELHLPEGTTLALYNTGLLHTDGRHTTAAQQHHLGRALASAADSLQDRCDAVHYAMAPHDTDHDVVLLLARTRRLGPDRAAVWTWPNDPSAIADARSAVRHTLAAWGLHHLKDSTALIASELATNAVRYTSTPFQLRLIRTEYSLTCEVIDDNGTSPQLRHADDTDEGGRGLFITSQLTENWGVRPARRGKAIWAEQALHPA
ncbi:SpoIIE family protein phosphatase [Streptomyces erythrochromogenes]|uniref:SpoIIE family protein phosphatase n=1 Tax=Streptomyces erythrochromogenes TaxID=285574 RepID=UPI00386A4C7A|nr:SpoIIE family protein phosphatase [Streptomyces erythrochromogenes]WST98294.1 SpoIIE family protein phosphatase [Streptomyces erythrochromogenes]